MSFFFFDPKDIHDIAWVKRTLEYVSLVKGFKEKLEDDPEKVLKEYNIPLSVQDISFDTAVVENNHIKMRPEYPDSAAAKYAAFMEKKYDFREILKENCKPDNEVMNKWRTRQMGRCNIELGARTMGIVHVPLAIELADGCSVGCKFCGLNAKKLAGVFECTEENAKLFRDVCTHAYNIIGRAAGMGMLYFASEPFDNPDYEKFLDIFRGIFDVTPQITTARAVNNIERLRPLLKDINEKQNVIYRFSALSEAVVLKLFEAFTPEELILTEILPQYDDAPTANFVSVGRNATEEDCGDTISCVTGFVVNMYAHRMRLTTPTNADKNHPTGEIILDERIFTDADDFAVKLNEMIKQNMVNIIGPNDRIRLRKNIKISYEDKQVVLQTDKGIKFNMEYTDDNSKELYKTLFEKLKRGYNTKREVVAEFTKDKEMVIQTELLYFILNKWWSLGLIETESGRI